MPGTNVSAAPCVSCPYRIDVPSGVWAAEEYAKLPEYDWPTFEQPFAPFMCHTQPDAYCHGWAVCHSNRGHEFELLALRLALMNGPVGHIPEPVVPLFSSGTEAAAHGVRDIKKPSRKARATIDRLLARYARLRTENKD